MQQPPASLGREGRINCYKNDRGGLEPQETLALPISATQACAKEMAPRMIKQPNSADVITYRRHSKRTVSSASAIVAADWLSKRYLISVDHKGRVPHEPCQ